MTRKNEAERPARRRGRWGGVALLMAMTAAASGGAVYAVVEHRPDLLAGVLARLDAPDAGSPVIAAPKPAPPQGGQPVITMPQPAPAEGPVPEVQASASGLADEPSPSTAPDPEAQIVIADGQAPLPAGPSSIEQAITEVAAINPEMAEAVADARVLKEGQTAVDWGVDNLGYISQASRGDEIPGITLTRSAPETWDYGDAETEGGGDAAPTHRSISGPVTVGDDGVISVSDTTVVLSGIMLPGADAQCSGADGEAYDCLGWAVAGLREFVGGKTAFCSVSGMSGLNYALCDVITGEDGQAFDLASWMVSAGVALASDVPEPSLYRQQENDAKARKAGLWEGRFAFGGRASE